MICLDIENNSRSKENVELCLLYKLFLLAKENTYEEYYTKVKSITKSLWEFNLNQTFIELVLDVSFKFLKNFPEKKCNFLRKEVNLCL